MFRISDADFVVQEDPVGTPKREETVENVAIYYRTVCLSDFLAFSISYSKSLRCCCCLYTKVLLLLELIWKRNMSFPKDVTVTDRETYRGTETEKQQ